MIHLRVKGDAMRIVGQLRRGEIQREASIPAPREPVEDLDLSRLYARIRHVAVCTGGADRATFLLRTEDGGWQTVAYAGPTGTRLLMYLAQLPGFDLALLRSLLDRPCRTQQVTSLWSAD